MNLKFAEAKQSSLVPSGSCWMGPYSVPAPERQFQRDGRR